MEIKRVGIYARVSTVEQNTANQLIDLRRFTEQRGWVIAGEYVDHGISGAKDKRPALDDLMAAARRRRLDIVLVWKFDRFARSAKHLLVALDEFKSLGVDFISLQDSIDTTSPYGRAMFTIIGVFAELEREMIRDRVRNGVQKARERGKRLGRPHRVVKPALMARLLELRGSGHSIRAIAQVVGMKKSTIADILSEQSRSKVEVSTVERRG